MQVICPKCGHLLAGSDMNVATDVARCTQCDEVFALSSIVQASASGPVDLNDPPRGAWYGAEFNGFIVGATTRHPIALFLVPFMCVWSGFSLGGIYGAQIAEGKFNLAMALFGIPFVLGTLFFGSVALMAVCGKVVVRVRNGEGVVFTGIGAFGWQRRFDWHQVTSIRVEPYHSHIHRQTMTIVLDGPRKLRFGGELTEPRLDFVANVLRQELTTGSTAR